MDDGTHPLIALFQDHAEVLDATGRRPGVDGAIVKLTTWMSAAADHLSEDDVALLAEIGAILYQDGLDRRLGGAQA